MLDNKITIGLLLGAFGLLNSSLHAQACAATSQPYPQGDTSSTSGPAANDSYANAFIISLTDGSELLELEGHGVRRERRPGHGYLRDTTIQPSLHTRNAWSVWGYLVCAGSHMGT